MTLCVKVGTHILIIIRSYYHYTILFYSLLKFNCIQLLSLLSLLCVIILCIGGWRCGLALWAGVVGWRCGLALGMTPNASIPH